MKRRVVLGVASVSIAAAAIVFAVARCDRGDRDGGTREAAGVNRPEPRGREPIWRRRTGAAGLPRSISGHDPRGSLRLEGQVIDDAEQPVAGARVRVSSVPPRTASTERDGSFAFDGLLAIEYTISAVAGEDVAGPVVMRLSATSEPVILRTRTGRAVEVLVVEEGSGAPIAGARVTVGPGEVEAVTGPDGKAVVRGLIGGVQMLRATAMGHAPAQRLVELAAEPGTIQLERIELALGAEVSGKVIDEDGRPVPGAQVTARDASFDLSADETANDLNVTVSGPDGSWRFDALARGSLRFHTRDEQHEPGASRIVAHDGRTATHGVEIRVAAGGRASGRVVSSNGTPVTGAVVQIGSIEAIFGPNRLRRQVCDEQGRFDVRGLLRTRQTLVATHESGSSAAYPLDLASHPEQTDLEIVLDIEGSIAGTVVTPEGEPVAEAYVSALPDLMSLADRVEEVMVRGTLRSVLTDASGRFELRGLPRGSYTITADAPGAASPARSEHRATRVPVGTMDARIVVETLGWITGRVRLADGTVPGSFRVDGGGDTATTFATTDGSFRLLDVRPGDHTLWITGPEFDETTVEVTVRPASQSDVGVVTLLRGRSVTGRVIDASGSPVAGADVTADVDGAGALFQHLALAAGTAEARKRAVSAADGTFALRGLSGEALTVSADHPAKGRSRSTPLPAGTDDATIELVVEAVGRIEGRVSRGDRPAPNVFVMALDMERTPVALATGSRDGSFVFDRLAPGPYAVEGFMVGGGTTTRRTSSVIVEVRSSETAHAELELAAGAATIRALVTADGKPVEQAFVSVTPADLPHEQAQDAGMTIIGPDSDGTAVLHDVKPGPIEICAISIGGDFDPAAGEAATEDDLRGMRRGCETIEVPAEGEVRVTIEIQPLAGD